jgi:hypothetical protein
MRASGFATDIDGSIAQGERNRMRTRTLLLAAAGVLLPLTSALAIPLKTYDLAIQFSSCTTLERDCAASDPVSTGVTYHGSFTIDPTVLQTDGFSNAGFQSFLLTLGDFTLDSLSPAPLSDYQGSRFYNPATDSGGFGPWTLLVQGGELAGICCGVFGSSDTPFVDLMSFSRFDSPPNYVGVNAFGGSQRFNFQAQGSFSFKPIAEPGSLALLALGASLMGTGLLARRRKRTT